MSKLVPVLALLFLGFQPIWVQSSLITPTVAVLAEAASPSPGARDEKNANLEKKILIGLAVVSTALATLSVSTICLWIWRCWQRSNQHSDVEKGLSLHTLPAKCATPVGKKGRVIFIEYETLERLTNGFSVEAFIGHGKLSSVYKACLVDNTLVAVKRFNAADRIAETQYQNEMNLLSRVQHPNITAISGYCAHQDAKLLVYEFMPNGSLYSQLHGSSQGRALNWHMRIKIALDTARGLEYLHEHCRPQVIHRDLTSSNILLDSKFNAKLTGFGAAITAKEMQNIDSIELARIPGCLAPEYLLEGKLTEKSDVYAYGVVLLELLFGREPVKELPSGHFQSIVTWAIPQLTDRTKLPNIVDPVIKDTMDLKHLYQVAAVAVLCVQQEPSYRPLITDVLHSLVPLVPAELGGSGRASNTTHCL